MRPRPGDREPRRTSSSARTGVTPTWPPTAATRSRSSAEAPEPARCASCRDGGAASATKGGPPAAAPAPWPGPPRSPSAPTGATSTWPRPAAARSRSSLATARTGALRQLAGAGGCISQRPGGGCAGGRALQEPVAVAVSPDGRRVYVAGRRFPSAVAVLTRRGDGTLTQDSGPAGCISRGGSCGCVPARAMSSPEDVVVSRDGRSVLVASSGSRAVAEPAHRARGPDAGPRAARVASRTAALKAARSATRSRGRSSWRWPPTAGGCTWPRRPATRSPCCGATVGRAS